MSPSIASLAAIVTLPLSVLAVTLDCNDVRDDGQSFYLSALGGVKTVHFQEFISPSVHNTTFALDICNNLKIDKSRPTEEQCPHGSRVCASEEIWRNGKGVVSEIIPIAGAFTFDGGYLNPTIKRLKGSSSNEDAKREGVRITLEGGKSGGSNSVKQRAIIEFLCDPNLTGNEGFEDESADSLAPRADEDEDDGGSEPPQLPDLDKGKSLKYISYEMEKDYKVLRLEWPTQHACENASATDPGDAPAKSGSGWGFFTWFIIIVFLLAATYIIFGSWLNYNRYGARGWDLIPHGDTIRDLPYILKDWSSSIVGKFQGGGSRGGYSAV